jgi:hypothetical protein
VPSVPRLPSVPVPQVPGVPSVTGGVNPPSLPAHTPSSSPSRGTVGGSPPHNGASTGGGSGATSTGSVGGAGGGGTSGAGATAPGARGATGSRRSAAARRTIARRERRLRTTVKGLQRCLGGLSGLEHRVLVLRAGIGAGPPRTRARVARRLHISARRVTRLERRGVRRLRGLAGAGRCGSDASPGAAQDATAAPGRPSLGALLAAGPHADRTEVKAERESSHGRLADDATPGSRGGRHLMALPQARILGFDFTPPLLIVLGLGALVWAVRTVRRERPPGAAA